MKLITRNDTINILLDHSGNLKCSNDYRALYYERTLTNAWDCDRHIQIGFFDGLTKEKSKFVKSNLLFFEIDDFQLKKKPIIWKDKIQEHKRIITSALAEFLDRDNININPLLATFSGSKSIHFIFKFDEYLTASEYETCRLAIQTIVKKTYKEMLSKMIKKMNLNDVDAVKIAKKMTYQQLSNLNFESLRYPNISKLDMQVSFNCSASPRISCDIPQDNRLKQESFFLTLKRHMNLKQMNS